MRLQGNLQIVFDALYRMGVIAPVLDMNWSEALDSNGEKGQQVQRQTAQAVQVANQCQSDSQNLEVGLAALDQATLQFLAMEVAREYADFHSRTTVH